MSNPWKQAITADIGEGSPGLSLQSRRAAGGQKLASWSAFLTASLHALSAGLLIGLIQKGHFQEFDCLKILQFVPHHLLLWRTTWLATALSSLSLLLFCLAYRQCLERRHRTLSGFAVLLVAIGAACSVQADASVMILFGDLAQELNLYFSANHVSAIHLSWATLSQFLSSKLLIANLLDSIAGMILVVCTFRSRVLPRVIAWTGLPVWLAAVNASVITGAGNIEAGLTVYFAAKLLLILWSIVCGISFHFQSARLQAIGEITADNSTPGETVESD